MQYAYKKDGKGERHGDQAERMLAAQARKHNVQPQGQPLPPGLFSAAAPNPPAAMMEGDVSRAMNGAPNGPGMYSSGRPSVTNSGYQPVHPSQQRHAPPPQALPAPPLGLPARPPPSQAGYGGPQGFLPPGFNQPQQPGFPQQGVPPPAMGAPPPAFAPPGFGPPPGLPPGFQQQGYGRAR